MPLGSGELWMKGGLGMKFRLLEDAGRRVWTGVGSGGGRDLGDISK